MTGRFLAVDAPEGTLEWVTGPFATAVGSSPVSVDGVLYFGAHSFGPSPDVESGLFALETDGSERWRYVPGARHEGFGSSPAVVGRTLYVGGTTTSSTRSTCSLAFRRIAERLADGQRLTAESRGG